MRTPLFLSVAKHTTSLLKCALHFLCCTGSVTSHQVTNSLATFGLLPDIPLQVEDLGIWRES